jgi:hypothetical protein
VADQGPRLHLVSVDDVARSRTDVEEPMSVRQAQAALPSDFEADFVAVLVVPGLEDESADEDEPPDLPDLEGTFDEPESDEPELDALSESFREDLPLPFEPFRELFLESFRESFR